MDISEEERALMIAVCLLQSGIALITVKAGTADGIRRMTGVNLFWDNPATRGEPKTNKQKQNWPHTLESLKNISEDKRTCYCDILNSSEEEGSSDQSS